MQKNIYLPSDMTVSGAVSASPNSGCYAFTLGESDAVAKLRFGAQNQPKSITICYSIIKNTCSKITPVLLVHSYKHGTEPETKTIPIGETIFGLKVDKLNKIEIPINGSLTIDNDSLGVYEVMFKFSPQPQSSGVSVHLYCIAVNY